MVETQPQQVQLETRVVRTEQIQIYQKVRREGVVSLPASAPSPRHSLCLSISRGIGVVVPLCLSLLPETSLFSALLSPALPVHP